MILRVQLYHGLFQEFFSHTYFIMRLDNTKAFFKMKFKGNIYWKYNKYIVISAFEKLMIIKVRFDEFMLLQSFHSHVSIFLFLKISEKYTKIKFENFRCFVTKKDFKISKNLNQKKRSPCQLIVKKKFLSWNLHKVEYNFVFILRVVG